ncbi:hypothetical protein WR25_09951 [Diploscapter pachys]|uniref:Band 7 domain-containing protein n=1 Tax=Diploscapter pachys TaxID=2018661 RepID=A0A2A2J238_9BILA|nr:hypothetical protein WR25_09951 [Diploscapter pachys]
MQNYSVESHSGEHSSNESERLMEEDERTEDIQIEVPQHRGRTGRRFTLNPLIFAKEEREARRQSLAQLKLSYYPKHINPEHYDAGIRKSGYISILTKDSVTTSVDAVVYYRVSNATVSVANIENAHGSTRLLAQTTLRNMLGTRSLSEILSDRESLAIGLQSLLDEATESWGIKVERVEIKDVRLPVQVRNSLN